MVSLRGEVDRLVCASLSENTKRVYSTGDRVFSAFRNEYNLPEQWPVPIDHVTLFVAYMSLQQLASSTAATYLSALSYRHKSLGWTDPTKNFIVRKMLEGMRKRSKSEDARAPITLDILNKLPRALDHVCLSEYESKLFKAAFILSFFGFLRVGELAYTTAANADRPLKRGDIQVLQGSRGSYLQVVIRFSKTDQCGRSVVLHIKSLPDSHLCPVKAIENYSTLRPFGAENFFCHMNGTPLTAYQFSAVLGKAIRFLGIPSVQFKSHSFRIGACTTACMNGVSHEVIQAWGRWKSDAYKSYIRLNPINLSMPY